MRSKFLRAVLLLQFLLMPLDAGAGDNESYEPTTLVFPAFLHTYGIRKATKTHFMIYTKNKVKVRDPQGIAVVRLKSWDDPSTTKDDDEITGYGVNSGENVIVYNTSMTGISLYGLGAKGEEALRNPTAIAANADGDVYVADTGNHRIVRLKNPKRNLTFLRGLGGFGALPGQFNAPQGVALGSNGMVFVGDTGNHRIQVLRPDGQVHLWFGTQGVEDGQIWHPTDVAVTDGGEPWSHYKDRFVAFIDLDHTRIQKFTLDGDFIDAVRLSDFGYDSGHLAYLALDYYSNIWVTDKENHCVHKFDRNLNYLTSFGRHGSGDKEFNEPRGIAIYKRFGQVFIAEKESAQYYWIGTDVLKFEARVDPETGCIVLELFLTEPSFAALTVKPEGSGEPHEILKKARLPSGEQKIYVDGRWNRVPEYYLQRAGGQPRAGLEPVPRGRYRFNLEISATYSSYQHFSKEVSSTVQVP